MTASGTDHGMAGAETWALGVLVFAVGSLLVAWAWAAVRARSDAAAIAHEYLRAFTEAPDAATAYAVADDAVRTVAAERRIDPTRVRVTPPEGFGRCRLATVTVRLEVAGPRLAGIAGLGPAEVRVTRAEMTDPYRELTRDARTEEAEPDAPTLCDEAGR